MIGTGIRIQLNDELSESESPDDFRVGSLVLPRSGRGSKEGLCIGNTVGLIDADYQGEIMLMIWARPTGRGDASPIVISQGERIAQLILTPVIIGTFHVVKEFRASTVRGSAGHGSTGHQ